jgi:putative DNA primase/helicase
MTPPPKAVRKVGVVDEFDPARPTHSENLGDSSFEAARGEAPPLELNEAGVAGNGEIHTGPNARGAHNWEVAGEYANHWTDAGNGHRVARLHGDRFRYDADRAIWRAWDGRRWEKAVAGELTRAAVATMDEFYLQAAKIADPKMQAAAKQFALDCQSAARISAMIKMASSETTLETRSKDYDAHHDLLNVANGTLDLRTGQLRPHRREDCLTKLTPIAFDPAATCPRWQRFLTEVFSSDQELIAFLKRAIGYSLSGHTREDAFLILYGATGRNGKGTLIRRLMKLLGDAAHTTLFSTFTVDRAKQTGNTPELAAMVGKRVVCAGEPDDGVKLSEGLIKQLTGSDEIEATAKYEAPFRYTPTFKIWLHCNYKPEIRGTDGAIWSRPRLVPFNVSFLGREDRELENKLDAELPGILNWAAEGAREWYASGLGNCTSVSEATKEYRAESDPLGNFIADCVTVEQERFTSNEELRHVYEKWCERNGQEPWSPNTFGRKFKARGYEPAKPGKGSVRGYVNIRAEAPKVQS